MMMDMMGKGGGDTKDTKMSASMRDKKRKLMMELAKHGTADVPGCSPVSRTKAREILHDGTVHGHALTGKQRRYMGWIAGGAK